MVFSESFQEIFNGNYGKFINFFLKKLTTMRRPSRTNNNRDDSTEGDSDAEDNNRTETVAR